MEEHKQFKDSQPSPSSFESEVPPTKRPRSSTVTSDITVDRQLFVECAMLGGWPLSWGSNNLGWQQFCHFYGIPLIPERTAKRVASELFENLVHNPTQDMLRAICTSETVTVHNMQFQFSPLLAGLMDGWDASNRSHMISLLVSGPQEEKFSDNTTWLRPSVVPLRFFPLPGEDYSADMLSRMIASQLEFYHLVPADFWVFTMVKYIIHSIF